MENEKMNMIIDSFMIKQFFPKSVGDDIHTTCLKSFLLWIQHQVKVATSG